MSYGNITPKVYEQCKKVYKELDTLIKLIGLEYDFDSDEYICTNTDQVDEDWCDREMLSSIDTAYADLKYFLS